MVVLFVSAIFEDGGSLKCLGKWQGTELPGVGDNSKGTFVYLSKEDFDSSYYFIGVRITFAEARNLLFSTNPFGFLAILAKLFQLDFLLSNLLFSAQPKCSVEF